MHLSPLCPHMQFIIHTAVSTKSSISPTATSCKYDYAKDRSGKLWLMWIKLTHKNCIILATTWHILWGLHSFGKLSGAVRQSFTNCHQHHATPQTALWQKPKISHRIQTFLHVEFQKFTMLFPHRCKYFLWHPIFKHPQPMFFPYC